MLVFAGIVVSKAINNLWIESEILYGIWKISNTQKIKCYFQLLQRQLQKSSAKGEGMHEVESRTPHVDGKGPLADGDAAKKSSSALATTASTCQVPGGTRLLVGRVLGKCASRTEKQQIKGPPDWKLSNPKDKRLENAELHEFKWTAAKNERSDNQVLLPTFLPPVVTDNLYPFTHEYFIFFAALLLGIKEDLCC
jgi:hypothetical protein